MPDSVWDAACDFYQSAADGDPVSREVAMKEGPILWLMSKTKTSPQTTVSTQQR